MGILFSAFVVCTILIIIACSESSYKFDTRFGISYAALLLMTLTTVIIATRNKDFITSVIDDYENGEIIKIEKVIIEDTDTIKVVEYKYK